jgi:gamma-glutamylcysteine synthetase
MPMMWLDEADAMKLAKEQLELGIRMSGMSLMEQKKDYFEQLELIEDTLNKYCNGVEAKKGMKKVSKILNQPVKTIYSMWCINICCLLILKAIPDDDMYGIMKIK